MEIDGRHNLTHKFLESRSFSELVDELTAISVEFLRSNCFKKGLNSEAVGNCKKFFFFPISLDEGDENTPT